MREQASVVETPTAQTVSELWTPPEALQSVGSDCLGPPLLCTLALVFQWACH